METQQVVLGDAGRLWAALEGDGVQREHFLERLTLRLGMSGLGSRGKPVQPPWAESLPHYPAAPAPHCVDLRVTDSHSLLIPGGSQWGIYQFA